MTPLSFKIAGKTLATLGMLMGALAVVCTAFGGVVGDESLRQVFIGLAAFLAALSAFLAHKVV